MSEEEYARKELDRARKEYAKNPCSGTKYSLEMAIAECELLGIDTD